MNSTTNESNPTPEQPRPSSDEALRGWHRRICDVTPWLAISGDLDPEVTRATTQLEQWVHDGITDIVDVRSEWSDEAFVQEHQPQVTYHYLGTHDNGGPQADSWFTNGIAAYREARSRHDGRLMVHCHMGINRGPSMALAMLLEDGWDLVAALNAIRQARPIAAVAYAHDALRAHHRRHGLSPSAYLLDQRRLDEWFGANAIDVARVIRLIRQAA